MSVETMISPITGHVTGYRAVVRQYNKKVHSRVFQLKSEARKEEAIMKAEIIKGRNILPQYKELPLKEAFDEWFEKQVSANGGYSYKKEVLGMFNNHIFAFFGNRDLRTIKPENVLAFRERLLKKGLTRVSVNSIIKKLKAIANYHIEEERLLFNPVKRKHTLTTNQKEHVVWTKEECRRFLDFADKKYQAHQRDIYLIYKIAINCGLRWGEIAALTVNDLDFGNARIKINKSYCQVGKYLKLPKSGKVRFAAMPEGLAAELKQYIEKDNVFGLLFKNKEGSHYSYNTFRNCHWKKDVKAAAVPFTKFHNLRRLYCMLFIEGGGNEVMLRKLVGHQDERMTDLYTTVRQDFKQVSNLVNF